MERNILDYFDVSLDFLSKVVRDNPSLRGMVQGYLAEAKLHDALYADGKATAFRKDDDHDRKKKGDIVLTYKGHEYRIEVKSLQTNSIQIQDPESLKWIKRILKQKGPGIANPEYIPVWTAHRFQASYHGKFQCDGSDRRMVKFPDGTTLETTSLLFGEFDILAVGLFPFREKWEYAYILNRDLPKSAATKYTSSQRELLIASMIKIDWPISNPFKGDIYPLLDILHKEREAGETSATQPNIAVPVEPETGSKTTIKVVKRSAKKKS